MEQIQPDQPDNKIKNDSQLAGEQQGGDKAEQRVRELELQLKLAQERIAELEMRLKEVEELVEIDEKTGLLNERGWQRQLFEQAAELIRHGEPLAVLAIDLDNLKKINDTFGHETGDKWLTFYGEVMNGGLRPEDVKSHLHGDEYIALLPRVSRDDAEMIRERLNARLVEMTKSIDDDELKKAAQMFGLGASVGISHKEWTQEERESLKGISTELQKDQIGALLNPTLRSADDDMYAVKAVRKVTRT